MPCSSSLRDAWWRGRPSCHLDPPDGSGQALVRRTVRADDAASGPCYVPVPMPRRAQCLPAVFLAEPGNLARLEATPTDHYPETLGKYGLSPKTAAGYRMRLGFVALYDAMDPGYWLQASLDSQNGDGAATVALLERYAALPAVAGERFAAAVQRGELLVERDQREHALMWVDQATLARQLLHDPPTAPAGSVDLAPDVEAVHLNAFLHCQVLDLRHRQLTDALLPRLLAAIAPMRRLGVLDLSHNELGDAALDAVLSAIAKNHPRLLRLEVAGNAFCAAARLRLDQFHQRSFDYDGNVYYPEALWDHPSVRLCCDYVRLQCATALTSRAYAGFAARHGPELRGFVALLRRRLAEPQVDAAALGDCHAWAAKRRAALRRLEELDLEGAVRHLPSLLALLPLLGEFCPNLRSLDLSNDVLRDAHVGALADALPRLVELRTLVLCGRPLGAAAYGALEAAAVRKLPRLVRLRTGDDPGAPPSPVMARRDETLHPWHTAYPRRHDVLSKNPELFASASLLEDWRRNLYLGTQRMIPAGHYNLGPVLATQPQRVEIGVVDQDGQ